MAPPDSERLKGNLDLLLLSVLTVGPAHGYAVIAHLRERSAGTFDLPEGTVYPALHRLERDGLLEAVWQRGEGGADTGGRRRKVYAVTPAGAAALAAERSRWDRFTAGVGSVLHSAQRLPAVPSIGRVTA
jgi:PadR family transcriptional regulator